MEEQKGVVSEISNDEKESRVHRLSGGDNQVFLDAEDSSNNGDLKVDEINFDKTVQSNSSGSAASESNETLAERLNKELNIDNAYKTECDSQDSEKYSQSKTDKSCDKGDNYDEEQADYDQGSEVEEDAYHSADDGDYIVIDETNLKEMEERLSEEEKNDRRQEAQTLKENGNSLFREGDYKGASKAYGNALVLCPLAYVKDRSIMYSNRAACFMRMENFEQSIEDSSKALELNPEYFKALLRRAELYEKTDKLDEALVDYKKIMEMDPSHHAARAACMRLPDQIKERNEKMKEEMMGKLKDLGNMILKPFGLSTNNFQLNQDPNTGGYSVQFNNNGN